MVVDIIAFIFSYIILPFEWPEGSKPFQKVQIGQEFLARDIYFGARIQIRDLPNHKAGENIS